MDWGIFALAPGHSESSFLAGLDQTGWRVDIPFGVLWTQDTHLMNEIIYRFISRRNACGFMRGVILIGLSLLDLHRLPPTMVVNTVVPPPILSLSLLLSFCLCWFYQRSCSSIFLKGETVSGFVLIFPLVTCASLQKHYNTHTHRLTQLSMLCFHYFLTEMWQLHKKM